MSTAIARKTYDLMSKNARLRLVRRDPDTVLLPEGRTYNRANGVAYQFSAGRLSVVEGQDMLPDGPPDPTDPDFKPTMQDAISWLRSHRLYNQQGAASEGFYEMGREPDRLQPYEEDVRDMIAQAGIALDEESLERLMEEERGGHNRAALIREAERSLEIVRVTKASLEAQAAAAAAENAGNGPETPKPAKAAPAKKAPAAKE